MLIKTVLNRVHKVKGFVYEKARFFKMLGRKRAAALRLVCSDLWQPYLKEFSCGIVEGLNYKIKLTLRKAYGFRSTPEPHLKLTNMG